MTTTAADRSQFSRNEQSLMAEAVRRVCASRHSASVDPNDVSAAIAAEMQQGRRDLFGLVRAGSRAGTRHG